MDNLRNTPTYDLLRDLDKRVTATIGDEKTVTDLFCELYRRALDTVPKGETLFSKDDRANLATTDYRGQVVKTEILDRAEATYRAAVRGF